MNSSDHQGGQSHPKKKVAPTNGVYGAKTPGFVARCIYFYYLKESSIEKEKTKVYFVERNYDISDINEEIDKILKSIFITKELTPCGWRLGDIRWRRISYLIVLFEDPIHKLEEGNAVTFKPYHAFKGGDDIKTINSYPNVTGFYCENHMKLANNTDVDAQGDPFYLFVNHDGHHDSGPFKALTHNDTGTNMGPPIPPP